MKKTLLFLLLALLGMTEAHAVKRVTNKGVQYEQIDDETARIHLTPIAKGDIVIQETITIGKAKLVVVEMAKAYFKKNKKISSIELPRTMTKISAHAFEGCSNLTKIILPLGFYDIEDNAFDGCDNISDIQGNVFPFQEYRKKTGYVAVQINVKKTAIPLFSTYANDRLKQKMELWQTKKDYETVDMYKSRVTDENRRKRMDEFVTELKAEYVEFYAPAKVNTILNGSYDPEYEVFPIRTDSYGNVFAKVPKEDAHLFRQNYRDVIFTPKFGVQGDTLSILSCTFTYNGKTYTNATDYTGTGGHDYQFALPPLDIDLAIAAEEKKQPVRKVVDRTIDKDIPQIKGNNDKTFVLIIGNEKYKRIAEVPYANNDAKVFADYCEKTLGIPQKNIDIYRDASINDMRHAIQVLTNRLKAFNGEARALVYYSGHGYPDEATRMPYLMPIDGFATDISNTGYSLNDIYDELAEAPSQLTLLLLDACFSGTTRQGDMAVNAKGVAIRARSTVPTGNMLVFSASQGTETAYVDDEHGHGRFTYYLLKHLHDTKGDTTVGSLVDFVKDQVLKASVTQNDGKTQTPTANASFSLSDTWKDYKLR